MMTTNNLIRHIGEKPSESASQPTDKEVPLTKAEKRRTILRKKENDEEYEYIEVEYEVRLFFFKKTAWFNNGCWLHRSMKTRMKKWMKKSTNWWKKLWRVTSKK